MTKTVAQAETETTQAAPGQKPGEQAQVPQPAHAPIAVAKTAAAADLPPSNGLPSGARAAAIVPQNHEASGTGAPVRARMMNALQRTAGNARVGRMTMPVQTKLSVGGPNDALEREADHIAAQVMRMPERRGLAHPDSTSAGEPHVEHRCPACERAQRRCSTCEQEIHRKEAGHEVPAVTPEIEQGIHSSRGGGQPLARSTRDFMEPRFGQDFGGVRVHADPQAAHLARQLNAEAFTTGQDVFFAQDRYKPDTSHGRSLLAHELTHTVQQGSTPAQVSRQAANPPAASTPAPQAPPVDAKSVKDAVDIIIKALSGITFSWDSGKILTQFQGKSPSYMRALLQELKGRGPENKKTPDEMIRWMFGDMTAEDRRTLRQLLIEKGVLDDLGPILIEELVDKLSGWFDASPEIMAILTQFGGASLDDLLRKLEAATKKDEAAMADYLFDKIDRVSAKKLREHLLEHGGPLSGKYAAYFTAFKIHKLLAGFFGRISHSESTMVVENFSAVTVELRVVVQYRLDRLTRASMGKPAENVLMMQLDQTDYEQIQRLPGVTLRVFDRKVTFLDKIVSAAKWIDTVSAWITCGILGIITGILAAVWDIVKGLWDIVKAAWHILWAVAYLQSGGAVGSENYLAVKDFFTGMAKTVSHPIDAFDQMWNELKEEFNTIEGPLADCKRAEFVVRKVVGAIVNIILIFVAGYGLVKAGVSAVLEFAELAEQIGVLRALGQTALKAGRAILKFVPAKAGEAAEFASSLLKPGRILLKVGNQLKTILLAVDDEGLWGFMRGRGGGLLESERKFWSDHREGWRKLSLESQEKQAVLQEKVGAIKEGLKKDQVPEDHKGAARDFENETNNLKDEVDGLEREVKSDPEKGSAAATTAGELPKDYLEWEKQLSAETRAELRADRELRKAYAQMDPEVRRTLTLCDSPCIPTKPVPSPADVKRIRDLLDRLKLSDDDKGLQEYLHRRKGNLSQAVDGIQDVADLKELQIRLNKGIADIAAELEIKAILRSDGRWEAVIDGEKVIEYDVKPYSKAPGTESFFNPHHGIQGEWGRERLSALYDYDKAPTIQLRDTHAGTPHRTITTRQATRKAGRSMRTYSDELALLKEDMAAAGVPQAYVDDIVAQSNAYFANIYRTIEKTDPKKLLEIFGSWKP